MEATRVRFTSKTKRGLALMRGLCIDALDDRKPPASSIVASWTLSKQREFNQAMEWLEQLEEKAEAVEGGAA